MFTEEDVLGNYSRVLTKYFLAEGVVCKHDLLIASADEDPHEIVSLKPNTILEYWFNLIIIIILKSLLM